MLFFEKNPEFGRKRNSHKRYQEMLIHELVQPLLHKRNDDEPPTDMGCWSQPKKRSRINVQVYKMTFVLEAGIMQPRSILEGSALCVDTKRTN